VAFTIGNGVGARTAGRIREPGLASTRAYRMSGLRSGCLTKCARLMLTSFSVIEIFRRQHGSWKLQGTYGSSAETLQKLRLSDNLETAEHYIARSRNY
jgi:hypothetical protein